MVSSFHRDHHNVAHASHARHPRVRRVPSGDQWSHEVKWDGVRALSDVQSTGHVRMTEPQRERHHPSPGPSSRRARWATGTCWSTARSWRSTIAGSPTSAPSRTGCTSGRAAAAARLAEAGAGDLHGLRPAPLDGPGPHRRVAGAPEAAAHRSRVGARPGGAHLRTTTARCSTSRPGSRGSRGSSASAATPATDGGADPPLAEAPHRRRGRRRGGLAPAGRYIGPAGRPAGGEPTSAGLRYRGRVGSGIGPKIRGRVPCTGSSSRPVRQPVRRRGAGGGRARHALAGARAGGRRQHPRTAGRSGCGSRRTRGSATDVNAEL